MGAIAIDYQAREIVLSTVRKSDGARHQVRLAIVSIDLEPGEAAEVQPFTVGKAGEAMEGSFGLHRTRVMSGFLLPGGDRSIEIEATCSAAG